MKLLMEIDKTTWGKQTKGAYKQSLILRKEVVLAQMKEDVEAEK